MSTGVVEWSTCSTAFYSTEIAVIKGCYSVIFCNFKWCSLNVYNMQSHPIEIHPLENFPFQSDLETVNLKNNGWKEYLSIVLCWIFLFSIFFFFLVVFFLDEEIFYKSIDVVDIFNVLCFSLNLDFNYHSYL